MRIRSKLSRAEMIEKYDIMGEIERNKRSKGGIVIEQTKTNVDLYIDDVRAILNAQDMASVLTMTGTTNRETLQKSEIQPDFIVNSLNDLLLRVKKLK